LESDHIEEKTTLKRSYENRISDLEAQLQKLKDKLRKMKDDYESRLGNMDSTNLSRFKQL